MTDPVTGRVALFDETGSIGDRADPNSAINGPLNNPLSFLDHIRFHSDLDHFEVDVVGTASLTHASITGIGAGSGLSSAFSYDAGVPDDQTLVTHGLGYPPLALVAVGNNIIWPGMPIQTNGDGGGRYATAYVDNSNLGIFITATIGASNLVSFTPTYSYLIFKEPPADAGNILIDFDPVTGIVSMGLGKFSSDRPYLQVVPGGSPLGLSAGRTIDLNNGAFKSWNPDGTTYVPQPPGLATYLIRQAYGTGYAAVIGSVMDYAGTYAGPTSIQVQAP